MTDKKNTEDKYLCAESKSSFNNNKQQINVRILGLFF